MPWQLLMIFQNLLAALFVINSRQLAKKFKRATLPFNLLTYAFIFAGGITYALLHGLSTVHIASFMHYYYVFIFAGVCFAVSSSTSYAVLQHVDAAVASLLSTFNILTTVALSSVVLHEGLSWRQLLGGLLLIAGVELVVTIKVGRVRHNKLTRAVTLSIISAIFFAFALNSEKYLLNKVNLSTYLVFGWGFQFVGVCAVSVILGRRFSADFNLLRNAAFYKIAVPAGFIRLFGGMLFIFSLKLSNNLSIITILTGLKIIMAALLGAYLLKERDHLVRKLQAALFASFGIAIIYWK